MASLWVLAVSPFVFLFRKQKNTMPQARAPRATNPPMTPPTIAPIGLECGFGDGL
jgi:hypothetical protein